MNIILWIIFGALAGWIASKVMGTDAEQGAVANIIIGIIGAVIGGWVLSALTGDGVSAGFNLGSLLVAIAGSIILIAILRMLGIMGGSRGITHG